ncbi:hypothetical protein [Streptomyces sp. NPDC047999]|uniref:hypothetical protein n=1 Tax=Streptomyces sp. NPDC047999 TaxID=3365497 RepID=UPI00371E371A
MTIEYAVLPHLVGTALLGTGTGTDAEGPEPSDDPYASPAPLRNVMHKNGTITAELSVTRDLCLGHFKDQPKLPVAVLATAMTALLDDFIGRHDPQSRWVPGPLQLSARGLASAGQTVTLASSVGLGGPAARPYQCKALVGEETVASVDITPVLVP